MIYWIRFKVYTPRRRGATTATFSTTPVMELVDEKECKFFNRFSGLNAL
jgi:hypothetical protein